MSAAAEGCAWTLPAIPANEAGPPALRMQGWSTHLSVWPASVALARWLAANADELGLAREGLRLLELGSGAGWLGSALAANLPDAAAIVLTEHPSAADVLAEKCSEWTARLARPTVVHVQALDWAAFRESDRAESERAAMPCHGAFDVAVAADCTWNPESASCFVAAARAVLVAGGPAGGPLPCFIYGSWGRSPRMERGFLQAVAEAGMVAEVLNADPVDSKGREENSRCEGEWTRQVAEAVEADEDVDWSGCLFDDDNESGFLPPFTVYRLRLSAGSNRS